MRKCLLVVCMMFVFGLCGAAEGKLSVVCTDFPCYDFVRQAAGDRAEVSMLLKPGTEAHSYDPTPADILTIGEADLFVYIGGESDAWADGILDSFDGASGPARLRMMDMVDGLIEEDAAGEAHAQYEGPEYDEHIWTSPKNAARMALAAGEALAALDPDGAEAYRRDAEAYAGEIQRIDGEIEAIVRHAARRELVFADRFPFIYLVRDYGLDYMAAFTSCTADTEPSAQTVMALIRRVIEDKLPAVYTIELSTQAIARTIAEETGVEILTLHSMQTVSQDEFEAGATWVSIMARNVAALEKGLV